MIIKLRQVLSDALQACPINKVLVIIVKQRCLTYYNYKDLVAQAYLLVAEIYTYFDNHRD